MLKEPRRYVSYQNFSMSQKIKKIYEYYDDYRESKKQVKKHIHRISCID